MIEDLQFGENDVSLIIENNEESFYKKKREGLKKLKITKHSWSIRETYQKVDSGIIYLEPDYQREEVWDISRQVAFIESLFMGILIPPIYLAEIKSNNPLENVRYEVVDGKQRLISIKKFLTDNLILKSNYLEYFNYFDDKDFSKINSDDSELLENMLSNTIEYYVISMSTEANVKYDVFSRLNKGAVKLEIDELRIALFHSELISYIMDLINLEKEINCDIYKKVFSKAIQKRKKDFGRFFRSVAFDNASSILNKRVENYNSRPKEMINNVLAQYQKGEIQLDKDNIKDIFYKTMLMLKELKKINIKNGADNIIDSLIPFHRELNERNVYNTLSSLVNNDEYMETFEKSPSTTKNVNKRLEIVSKFFNI